jgi:hypothetical protein
MFMPPAPVATINEAGLAADIDVAGVVSFGSAASERSGRTPVARSPMLIVRLLILRLTEARGSKDPSSVAETKMIAPSSGSRESSARSRDHAHGLLEPLDGWGDHHASNVGLSIRTRHDCGEDALSFGLPAVNRDGAGAGAGVGPLIPGESCCGEGRVQRVGRGGHVDDDGAGVSALAAAIDGDAVDIVDRTDAEPPAQ